MRRLVRVWLVVLPCFLVAGAWLGTVAFAGFVASDLGSVDALMPGRVALAVVAATINGPMVVIANAATMAVAAAVFVACVAIAGERAVSAAGSFATSALAAAIAAIVVSLPEVRLTPTTMWREPTFVVTAVGAFAGGLLTALLLRLWRARPSAGAATDTTGPQAERGSLAASIVALAIALAAVTAATHVSEARDDNVLLRREAKADADRFQAASLAARAARAGELLSAPGARASMSETKAPNSNPTPRTLRDRTELEAEIAAIHARVGPPLKTTRAEYYERDAKGDRTGYSVHFRHYYAAAEIGEALYYRLSGGKAELTVYNLVTNAGGSVTGFVGLLVAR